MDGKEGRVERRYKGIEMLVAMRVLPRTEDIRLGLNDAAEPPFSPGRILSIDSFRQT